MGLMDRDYYREKKPEAQGVGDILAKIKNNPLAIIAITIAVLFILSLIL